MRDRKVRNPLIRVMVAIAAINCLAACQIDQYTSANLSRQNGIDSTALFGRVMRSDTGEPIAGAGLQFGYQPALTDNYGAYSIQLQISEDNNRNLILPVAIRADGYMPFFEAIYITPTTERRDYFLLYAAPQLSNGAVIVNRVRGQYVGAVFEVQVTDFEGSNDVVSVRVEFTDINERAQFMQMRLQKNISTNTSIWQSGSYQNAIYVRNNFSIPARFIAEDKNGLRDSLESSLIPIIIDIEGS
jgi:hypothetical protein